MKILLIIISIALLVKLFALKITLEAIKIYLKKNCRYPSASEMDTCAKEYLERLLGKS